LSSKFTREVFNRRGVRRGVSFLVENQYDKKKYAEIRTNRKSGKVHLTDRPIRAPWGLVSLSYMGLKGKEKAARRSCSRVREEETLATNQDGPGSLRQHKGEGGV